MKKSKLAVELDHYESGGVRYEAFMKGGKFHRDWKEGPATTEFFKSGQPRVTSFYSNGKLHRPHNKGPASTSFFENGAVRTEKYYKDGQKHRPVKEGPAFIWYNEPEGSDSKSEGSQSVMFESYFEHGVEIDIKKPVTSFHSNGVKKSEKYYSGGKLHKEGKAAVMRWHENGQLQSEEWMQDGKSHREDRLPSTTLYYANGHMFFQEFCEHGKQSASGPAVIYYHENGKVSVVKHAKYNLPHREDGPAVTHFFLTGEVKSEKYFEFGKLLKTIKYNTAGEVTYER